jgi:hypothetical protein
LGKGWLRECEMLWRKAVGPNMLGLNEIGGVDRREIRRIRPMRWSRVVGPPGLEPGTVRL